MNTTHTLHQNHDILPGEFGELAALSGWGNPQDFSSARLETHFDAMDFVAHVRDSEGGLVGYVGAMSNGLGSVHVDSLLVHPDSDRKVLGALLLQSVLAHFPGQAVYAMPFVDEQEVFRAEGFKVYRREMIALAHRNDVPVQAAVGVGR